MIQGSNMTRSHKGMRKGISLLELLTAIVLLGILAGVGFKYYKVYYNTSFAAKQAKMYVMIEQAQQLSGAHSLFDTKNGISPINIDYMVLDKQLTVVPPAIPEVSNTGWQLWTHQLVDLYDDNATADANISLSGVTADNDIAFILPLDGNGTSDADKLDYCNIINNTGERSWSLGSTLATVRAIGTTPAAMWSEGDVNGTVSTDIFCYSADGTSSDGNLTVVFTVLVDLL